MPRFSPRIGQALGAARAALAGRCVGGLWASGSRSSSLLGGEPQPPPGELDVYPHKSVQRKEFGWGARSYWLFEPVYIYPGIARR